MCAGKHSQIFRRMLVGLGVMAMALVFQIHCLAKLFVFQMFYDALNLPTWQLEQGADSVFVNRKASRGLYHREIN